MAGCSEAGETTPATEQPVPATEQPAPAAERTAPTNDVTKPEPPEGIAPGERPTAPAMDLATAAEKLGVTEQQLSEALGDLSQGPMDLASAAEKLGVSEESLREALGFPEGGFPPGGLGPTGQGR